MNFLFGPNQYEYCILVEIRVIQTTTAGLLKNSGLIPHYRVNCQSVRVV